MVMMDALPSARIQRSILNDRNLDVMRINVLSRGFPAQEGAADCTRLHSSRPMDSISGVGDISSRNNFKYIVRSGKCNTCRVKDVQETAVWALQSLSPHSSGTEALPLGSQVKEKQICERRRQKTQLHFSEESVKNQAVLIHAS